MKYFTKKEITKHFDTTFPELKRGKRKYKRDCHLEFIWITRRYDKKALLAKKKKK